MYTETASKLYLAASATEYSQAVSMAGWNAVAIEGTVFDGGVTIEIEESNDLENWEAGASLSPTLEATIPGFLFGKTTASIASEYVRLKYVGGTSGAVVAAGINVVNL